MPILATFKRRQYIWTWAERYQSADTKVACRSTQEASTVYQTASRILYLKYPPCEGYNLSKRQIPHVHIPAR